MPGRDILMRATLLVLLKQPVPGRVKTRLAADIGAVRAAELYASWISVVLRQLQSFRPRLRLVGYYAAGEFCDFEEWCSLAEEWWPQPSGDLGERLATGFIRARVMSPSVLAIGTDCLDVTSNVLEQAITLLNRHDVVFGPTLDGGYYLVGTSRPLDAIFKGIRWSTSHTLTDSLERCRTNAWSTALLQRLSDIDTLEDWQSYLSRHCSNHDWSTC